VTVVQGAPFLVPDRPPSDPAAGSRAVLEITGLTITARSATKPLVDGLDLKIGRGEVVGLVGESGSGKSLTARSVLRLLPPGIDASGSITVDGLEVLGMNRGALKRLRGRTASMIFQDPRAHVDPLWRVADHLETPMREVQRLSRVAARQRAAELLDSLGIAHPERVLRQRPGELSGGMLQRVVIAGALAGDPSLLLADEPTTALDVTTQAEIASIIARLGHERGLATLFITHDLDLAATLCDRVVVLYAGRICEQASIETLFETPAHPYTAGLFAARPSLDGPLTRIEAIPGQPLSGAEVPPGCAFQTRCRLATDVCRESRPALQPLGPRAVACHRAQEVLDGG
jgi:oligopeptide/dipeptide ABC transporter ATP-binding protein